jgi:spore coat protein H
MISNRDIPSYSIFIHPENLKELRSDIWCDDPVMAKLKVEKKQFDIDIVFRGSHIRKFKKKSYHIQFIKPRYFFGTKELHLNSEFIDPSLIRNKLSLDFFSSIGTLSPECNHVLLKLNGVYQGVYLQIESVDEQFLNKRRLPMGPIYYAEDDDANFSLMSALDNKLKRNFESGYSRKIGTRDDDRFLRELIYKINTVPRAEFSKEIVKLLDVDRYLRWLCGVICTQNFDGFIHNYALYRRSDTGLFEIIPWDYDATWGRDIHGDELAHNFVPIEGYNTLTARLLDDMTFRTQYCHLLKEILDKQFTVEFLYDKIYDLYQLLRPYVMKDHYIKRNIDQYDQEPELILQYIQKRNDYLKNHLNRL